MGYETDHVWKGTAATGKAYNVKTYIINEEILDILKEISEIHDIDEYYHHSISCKACRVKRILDKIK